MSVIHTAPDFDDTEGESVLIGDEEAAFLSQPGSQRLLMKQKTQRSPIRANNKLNSHSKHTVKKSSEMKTGVSKTKGVVES
jgi:hypothetical protein